MFVYVHSTTTTASPLPLLSSSSFALLPSSVCTTIGHSLRLSLAQLASAAVKPSPSTFSADDSGLNIGNVDHTPLTRKSLEDVSDNVVLKSFKVNGVEIYRAAEV